MAEPGEIYVLVNDAMPGLVKVGKTRVNSAHRAYQLGRATGVPDEFRVVRIFKVVNVDEAELFAHSILEKTTGRPKDSREFFLGPVEKVIETLNQALLRFVPAANEMPEAWRRALAKAKDRQPRLAFAEFESAIQEGQVPSDPWWTRSASVVEALGAYAACSCFIQQEASAARLFAITEIRHAITEQMVKFLISFQIDEPERRAINFMRAHS